jgi:hypothetical protein
MRIGGGGLPRVRGDRDGPLALTGVITRLTVDRRFDRRSPRKLPLIPRVLALWLHLWPFRQALDI